jgi:hypothetical protein
MSGQKTTWPKQGRIHIFSRTEWSITPPTHCIPTAALKLDAILRKLVVILLYVSAFFGHPQGDTQQMKINDG